MYYLGIDARTDCYLNIGIVEVSGGKSKVIQADSKRYAGDLKASLPELLEIVLERANLTRADIAGVGATGELISADEVTEASGCGSVTLIKEVDAQAIGDSEVGFISDTYSVIRVNIGDTVDCALVIGGKIYKGFEGDEADIAHMTVDFDGRECSCGKKGCFEAYVSRGGLAKTAAAHGVKVDCPLETFILGTDEAKAAAAEYMELLACGLTNVINLFQPDALIIGGWIVNAGEALLKPLSEIIARDQYARHSPNKTVVKYADNKYSAVIGAAIASAQ